MNKIILNQRNHVLDLVRGVSALLVMAGHLRAALFKDFSEIESGYDISFIEKGFYFLTSLGHEAVMVFFVLSGFFVGGSVLKLKDNFNFVTYLISRLSRLWTPLLPVLILTFIVDYFIGNISNEVIMGDHYSKLTSGPRENYSVSPITFISNLFFLQTVWTPVFGTNGPLWSLANEFWYYILFPLFMLCIGYIPRSPIKRIIFSVLTVLIIAFISSNMMQGFLIWIMGVLVHVIYSRKVTVVNKWFLINSIILFLLSIVNSKANFVSISNGSYNDLFVGITFSILLLSLMPLKLPILYFINLRKIAFFLSEISYSLYIFHFPIILLIYGLFYTENQLIFGVTGILHFLIWFLFIVFFGAIFWYFFERNTMYVRNKLKNTISAFHDRHLKL